jgi:selenocysteine lyase/cysteine desulfurase/tryptophan 2,3-dioxygenase
VITPSGFREHFPALSANAYLAGCSLGPRSAELTAALADMQAAMDSADGAWPVFEDQVSGVRDAAAGLLGTGPDAVSLQPCASVAAYQVASGFAWPEGRRRILTTRREFPSIAHVWLAQERNGAEVIFVDDAADGNTDGDDRVPGEEDYLRLLDERVALVSVPLVTYRESALLPVDRIAAAARAVGARVFTDAYQALGTMPVTVDGLGCDYLVGGTMKYLLGLPGLAFLAVRPGLSPGLPPQLTGWFGQRDPFAFDPRRLDFADGGRRYETGTLSVPAVYAARAGLGLIAGLDLREVREHVAALTRYATERLAEAGERVLAPPERGAHVAFFDSDPRRLAAWLAQRGVVVSLRGEVVRLAIHFYTSSFDIDRACAAITRYRIGSSKRIIQNRALPQANGQGQGVLNNPLKQRSVFSVIDLIARLEEFGNGDPAAFPYEDVVAEFRRIGKHFVPKELLAALDGVRRAAADPAGLPPLPAMPDQRQLRRFLDCALDKFDGTYDYPSYTGLPMLPLPSGTDPERAARMHDRLLTLLVGDILSFELAAADGRTELLFRMRPDERITAKRCRLCLRVLGSRLGRLGISREELSASPIASARRVLAAIEPTITEAERRMLDLSMLPVDIVHDEYMFIRVLQSFESTFGLMGVYLGSAIEYLDRADSQSPPGGTTPRTPRCMPDGEAKISDMRAPGALLPPGVLLRDCATVLREAGPLFSLLATMGVDSFRLFRQFTEGASAIQSRGYKIMEALCRPPASGRLDSPAYRNVPDVRAQVLAGFPSLQEAVVRAQADSRLSAVARKELDTDMARFADALVQWRTTHYRLAVRMLGEAPGTGYTEGTPYLKAVQHIPVFDADAALRDSRERTQA